MVVVSVDVERSDGECLVFVSLVVARAAAVVLSVSSWVLVRRARSVESCPPCVHVVSLVSFLGLRVSFCIVLVGSCPCQLASRLCRLV